MSKYEVPMTPSGVSYGSMTHGGTSRLGLTDAGKVVLTGIGFVALTALIFPAFGILSILIWVVLIALLVGFVLRPKIQINGKLPDRIMVGQSTPISYTLKNVGRFPAYNLCVAFDALPKGFEPVCDEQIIPRIRPEETVAVTITIQPTRRGYYYIKQPTCQSSFPFNLFNFGTSNNIQENVIVLPSFYELQIPTKGVYRHVHAGSGRPTGHMGGSTEYAGNRPFMPGDSPRQIDARAWARLAVPATREYHDDFDYYVALVLDTYIPEVLLRANSMEIKELEAAVSLCASIAFTMNKDRLIDLLLVGPDSHKFTNNPRIVRLDKILDILAGIEPVRGDLLVQNESLWVNQLREISEIVFILLNWNKTYYQLIKLALQTGCHVTILLINEPHGIHIDQEVEGLTENIQFLPVDEILSGRVEYI